MTKIEVTPMQEMVVKLMQHGGTTCVYSAKASTDAEAKALLSPLSVIHGAELKHKIDDEGSLWIVKNYDGNVQYASVWVKSKGPDHG